MSLSIIIDLVVVAIIWIMATIGYKKGLIKTMYGIVAFILAAVLTALYHQQVAEFIMKFDFVQKTLEDINQSIASKFIPQDTSVMPLWMSNSVSDAIVNAGMSVAEKIMEIIITALTVVVTFIGIKILLGFLVGILDKLAKLPILDTINSTGGMLFGVLKGVIVVLVLCALLTAFMPSKNYQEIHNAMGKTYIAKYFYNNNILMSLIMK